MNNNPVFWEHGVFLQPQHFQLEYIQNIRRAAKTMSLLNPYLWGVRHLEINENSIASGIFEVISMELLLPSGEWVNCPGNGWLAPRSYTESWKSPEEPLTVYVGIAEFREGGGNVVKAESPEEAAESFRYAAPLEPDAVPDYYGDSPEMDVMTLRYNLRLCFGDEGGALWKIPIARLVRDGERVRLDERMAPPCVDISAVPALRRFVRDATETLLARSRQLDEYKIDANVEKLSEGHTVGVLLFAVLGILARGIPELNLWLEAPAAHPWNVYASLCRVAGELSVFAPDMSPLGEPRRGSRVIPAYDHTDLYNCYNSVFRVITRLVDSLVMGPQYIIDFESTGSFGVFSAVMPRGALAGGEYEYWLLVRSSHERELMSAITVGKLAPSSEMTDVVAQALPGVRLHRSEQPPMGLPRREDTLYFRIETSDSLWRSLEGDGEISYMLPGAPEDLRVEIAVVER